MSEFSDLPFEMVEHIASFISNNWKSWIFTCKTCAQTNNLAQVRKHSNHLLTLLKLYPDEEWSFCDMSGNPNLTWDYVLEHPDEDWDMQELSGNPAITWEIVQAHPLDWDYQSLSSNPNITWDIIKANPDKKWNSCMVSMNPNITWEIVISNLDYDWRGYNLICNPGIDLVKVKYDPNKDAIFGTNRSEIEYSDITWAELMQNPGPDPKYHLACDLTYADVKANPDLPWDYYELLTNKRINSDMENVNHILQTQDIEWHYELTHTVPMTWDIMKNNPQINWDDDAAATMPYITWDIVLDNFARFHPEGDILADNPNLTWDFVKASKEYYDYVEAEYEANTDPDKQHIDDWFEVAHLFDYPWLDKTVDYTFVPKWDFCILSTNAFKKSWKYEL